MLHRTRTLPRHGATLVEAALVYPVTLMLTLGTIVLGLGVLRYQETASLAREGARWASVRGKEYASETGNSAATSQDVSNYILGEAAGLNSKDLTVTVAWNTSNELTHTASTGQVQNTVSVTVQYQWFPEAYLGGITLKSTAVRTMSF